MSTPAIVILGGQGYVGSALSTHLLAAGFAIQSVDQGLRGTLGPAPNQLRRYQDLTPSDLSESAAVVLLAGHSSVAACGGAPVEAFANNVVGFVELVHKLRGQPLLYASSVSVHGRTAGRPAAENDPMPEPVAAYDLHKQTIERYARLAYPNSYGLRFGSVCGPAPNLRPELLLNSFVRSAICRGRVEVANPYAHRAILGINDLCRAVETILRQSVPPGCYNLSSTNVQIGQLAHWVADRFGVPLVEIDAPTPYDIQVSTDRFCEAAGFEFLDTVEGLSDALATHYRATSEC